MHDHAEGREKLQAVYTALFAYYGAQSWWPAESRFEMMVGAILTQNTAWKNVDKALANLKAANVLTPGGLRTIIPERLTELVRPAGFTSRKPAALKTLVEFLFREYAGRPENLVGADMRKQRAQLLALKGIGPETADAILLYAAEQPIFVIDAYTRRIVLRLGSWAGAPGTVTGKVSYDELQALFMENLPVSVPLYNEFHALLDVHAKSICTKRAPRCGKCPLADMCAKRIEYV